MRTWPEGTDPLVLEVDTVRKKGIHAFKRSGLNDSLPRLRAIGERLYPEISTERGPYPLLRALFGAAIIELEADESFAAEALFALDSDRSLSLEERRRRAAETYKSSHVTSLKFRQRLEKPIIEHLARAITVLRPEPVAVSSVSYVLRSTLINQCKATLQRTGRLVLVGDRGTGKSTLAMMVAAEVWSGKSPLVLRISRLMADVVNVLRRFGVPTRGADAAVLQHELIQLLQDMPELLVIIDDVVDWAFIANLLPTSVKCRIIVTSNRRPREAWQLYTVQVQDMEPAEAKQLALSRTSRLSDEQATELVRILRYRPLAIAHCAGYLEHTPGVTAALLLDALNHSVAATLSSVADATEQNLRSIYSSTIADLEAAYPAAVWLLEAAAFTQPILDNQPVHIGDELVGLCYIMVRLYARVPESTSIGTIVLTYNRALQLIRDRYLLAGDTSGMELHPLTIDILKDVFSNRALEVYLTLHNVGNFILSMRDEEQSKRLIALVLSQRERTAADMARGGKRITSVTVKQLIDELPIVALKLGLVVLGYLKKQVPEDTAEQNDAQD